VFSGLSLRSDRRSAALLCAASLDMASGTAGYLGLGGEWSEKLLWPAVLVHAVLTILLARLAFVGRPLDADPWTAS
jgi:hypothetical protein